VTLVVAQPLARQRDPKLTSNVYAKVTLVDTRAAVAVFASFAARFTGAAMAATFFWMSSKPAPAPVNGVCPMTRMSE
jgi:hypothetical protein